MTTMITNPILRGFHPDSSALRVGDDYYIATSTFEWWPGIDIYHSKDLVNWEWVAAPVNRESQVNLLGNYNSGSLWAPHLSYSDGKFWLVYTDVKTFAPIMNTLNYVITAPTITGPWSEPHFLTASGFDPSIYHDDDGRKWFLNMLYDPRPGHELFSGTVIQEFDPNTMELIGERKHFYKGTKLGVCEAPQILKKNGWYYLLCAAGGTGYMHAATVARARSLEGPFEDSPYTPIMTTRDEPTNPLQKSGHCCFLQIGDEWYITQICARPLTERGNCTLGRETGIQKIYWTEDGWPRMINDSISPMLEVPAPKGSQGVVQKTDHSERVEFEANWDVQKNAPLTSVTDPSIPSSFKTLRTALVAEEDYSLTARPGWLRLKGGQTLCSLFKQSLFARRWQSYDFDAETVLDFDPKNYQQQAGLVLFYDTDNWIYAYVSFDTEGTDRRVVQVLQNDHGNLTQGSELVPLEDGPVRLKVEVRHDKANFLFAQGENMYGDNPEWKAVGGDQPADHISDDYLEKHSNPFRCAFTGGMVGICAQDTDAHKSYADFQYFDYEEKREK
ncbi:xylan 1,4-beta-xylosidase [Bifidobacterium saguini DSM 23967]|uniref:Xylan 1,4-beta-xylosidase n=2 Tax=Bifidobacterium saguini TaxID=762210 RepID=A0A087D9V2_9BIFI|nr:glycoside hydrolase family 43 protein [Bifidobacterium saguini]KFI92302.1 xylan 1,4-beta-xylosidase [Bifidobacterium saguini DSM 23967]QTB91005.1 glycoside hydrolase family 43 protein [Bifidobacterium saguini]